jgi:hypothetical protein
MWLRACLAQCHDKDKFKLKASRGIIYVLIVFKLEEANQPL